jgi:hypothetical protein
MPSRIPLLLTSLAMAPLLGATEVDFAHDVVPILEKHCVECHGGDESKGGLSINTRALIMDKRVIVPGKPQDSIFIEVLTDPDPDFRMPPPDKKDSLNAAEIAVLERWITAGAPWEDGFTFAPDRYEPPLKPRAVVLPPGPPDANPIDLIVDAHLKAQNTEPPRPIDDRAFLRRLHLDLTGLPPAAQTIAQLTGDGQLDRAAAVDRLLADDQAYAEHWMTFWNDLLRNEYVGTGFIEGGRQQVTGWLYRSLLENKPFDTFIRELIAPTKQSAGFIKGIKWRGEVNASQTPEIQFSQNVSQVFLGINMKCASCHDSFTDRWTLREAYGLAAIYSEKPLELVRCDKPVGEEAVAAWIFPELGNVDPAKPRDERLKQLAELVTHPENGRTQRTIVNRIWNQMMGRGIVHPVDAMNTEPWNEDLLDHLANYFVASGYDLKSVMRLIATSRTYQSRTEVRTEDDGTFVFRGPVRKRMTAEQFIDSVRNVLGVWPAPDKDAFAAKGLTGGQLKAVMDAHQLEKWDDRPVRAVFAKRDELQAALGRPNREQIVSARPDIVTTLEAINLANGPELAGLLQSGAAKLHGKSSSRELIDTTYLAALSRPPTDPEAQVAMAILGESPTTEATEDFLWSVFMLPEFIYIN